MRMRERKKSVGKRRGCRELRWRDRTLLEERRRGGVPMRLGPSEEQQTE